jgi:ribosomal protein S18 acetylase RimI-like enzyme
VETLSSKRQDGLHKLEASHDLLPVADLIELCFSSTMDEDGWRFLKQIRRTARDAQLLQWFPGASEQVSYPLHGYVWTIGGQIVGNCSLIPFSDKGIWRYLIANVAVHPDHRRQGIAKQLTIKAIEHIREHGAEAAWLQVRDDNPVAHQLYIQLGFRERVKRDTWLSPKPGYIEKDRKQNMPAVFTIDRRRSEDWPWQATWLDLSYPPEVRWNLHLHIDNFEPGLLNDLGHWMSGANIRHWVARKKGVMMGAATVESTQQFADHLWLAVSTEQEDDILRILIKEAEFIRHTKRPLMVNYPAGRGIRAFEQNCYRKLNTLIWMDLNFVNET